MPDATVFRELNTVLGDLVDSVGAILGGDLCGVYLLGSFAVGDADVYSDVDFLVVTEAEVSSEQEAALQVMHGRLYALDSPWAQHLEGSYAPRERLRVVDPARSPFLFLDNGASGLVLDNHCNTAVVRWTLREHGIVLVGPEPQSIVERVSEQVLREEALAGVREYAEWAPEPTRAGPMSRWKQPYLVLTFCRLLYTLTEARVVSKREAGEWAMGALDPQWSDLIRRALDDRPDPWTRVHQLADPDLGERTLAFARYAMALADADTGPRRDG